MRLPQAAFVALVLLLLAGCSGEKESAETPQDHDVKILRESAEFVEVQPRREFILMREIVRQHELQRGNDRRIEAVEKALKERFPLLPDEGETEEEKRVFQEARALVEELDHGQLQNILDAR